VFSRQRGNTAFAPWRQEFRYAAVLAGLAVVAAWQGLSSGRLATVAAGLVLSVAFTIGARYAWASGRRRWYGKHVEEWAVAELIAQLGRWRKIRCDAGVLVPGHGDADLLVTGKKGARCLVEVKSYNRWYQGFWSMGARERRSIAQALDLAQALGCDEAVVWLPRGRPTGIQRIGLGRGKGGVKVMFGNPAGFAYKIKRLSNRKLRPKDG